MKNNKEEQDQDFFRKLGNTVAAFVVFVCLAIISVLSWKFLDWIINL